MDRRELLRSLAASAALPFTMSASPSVEWLRPPALKTGDTAGLLAPSTLVADPEDIATAVRTVEYFGLKPKIGQTVGRRYATHRESVEARLADLHSLFADTSVRAIFAVSGGYGAAHLLDGIDYELVRRNPKIFVGYSDITALHLAFQKKAGLVTFHGPVLLSAFTEYTQHWFRRALFEPEPLGRVTNPKEGNPLRPRHPLRVIRPGKAEGRLAGGNLTLIATTMGTPYELDAAGKLLLLEDVGEQAYSIDRMLTQLRLAGKLEQAAGIVVGECHDCGPREFKPSRASIYTVGEVLDNVLDPVARPILSGLTFGHTADQLTLPLGIAAVLDTASGTLDVLEAGVTRRG